MAVVAGVLPALPMVLAMTLVLWLIGVLRRIDAKWAAICHFVLGTLTMLWTVAQLLHLPLRFYLDQESARIAANTLGIAVGGTLVVAYLESMRGPTNVAEEVAPPASEDPWAA